MKKIFGILMFLAVFGMLIGSVNAADLQSHDFNGKFTLDVPGNYWFANANADGYEFQDGNGIKIQYVTTDDIKGATFADYLKTLGLKNGTADGNFTVFQKDGKYVVVANSSKEMYIITDKKLDEAKAIAASADLGIADNTTEVKNSTVTSTNASVELKSQDFHGLFKMDVPTDSDFGDTEKYDQKFTGDSISYADKKHDTNISYVNDKDFNETVIKNIVDGLKNAGANVSTDGDLYIISVNGTNEIIFHEGAKTVTIISSGIDADTLNTMAKSIEFSK